MTVHTDVDGEALRILAERATRAERERDEARAALARAYPRALRAAAEAAQQSASLASRDGAYSEAEALLQLGRTILALTPKDIERITKDYEHE